jgi:hypothetical protein
MEVEAEGSMAAGLAVVGSMVAEAASADITGAAMGATAGVLLAGTMAAGMAAIVADTVDTTEDRTVVAAADTAMVGGDLEAHAARLAGCEAARRCAVPGHRDRGHLTGVAASGIARRDGIRFREEAMLAACPRDLAVPEWRVELARAESIGEVGGGPMRRSPMATGMDSAGRPQAARGEL